MRACLDEYARVLKPGRWMRMVFSNSSNAVWRAIQEALGTAGLLVADVQWHGSLRVDKLPRTNIGVCEARVEATYSSPRDGSGLESRREG